MKYLALLRGINVGGKGIVRMSDLRACFERLGFQNVSTYIQSGNVLFESSTKAQAKAAILEEAIAAEFRCDTAVVVLSEQDLSRVVEEAPDGFGADPDQYRYDVVFLMPSARPSDLLPTIRLKEGVDEAWAGRRVLYLRRLTARASQSHLPKLVAHPAYKSMTIRNWNTTTTLRKMISRT